MLMHVFYTPTAPRDRFPMAEFNPQGLTDYFHQPLKVMFETLKIEM
jgi:hypothetical protein